MYYIIPVQREEFEQLCVELLVMHFLVRQSLPYKLGFDILGFPTEKSENHSKYKQTYLHFR